MISAILAIVLFLGIVLGNPQDLVALFIPIIVYLATALVNFLKKITTSTAFGGSMIVTFIVPILSFVVATIYNYMATPDLNFWIMFLLGFAGTFFKEMLKQWNQSTRGIQTPAKTHLLE